MDMLERTAFDSQIAEQWMRDFPQQFQGRRNIECLVRAFARQLKEVQDVFRELEKLDLETAKGKNLDMVGDIVGLTRKEAGNPLYRIADIGSIYDISSFKTQQKEPMKM